jgi:hypothetical protein
MPSLADTLAPWHDFFILVGTASATLIGLLFVAASLGSGIFSLDRRYAARMFLSSSVVHFSCVLAACLIAVAPIRSWPVFGALACADGVFGLTYGIIACRDSVRHGLPANMDRDDLALYMAVPLLGYFILAASGAMFLSDMNSATFILVAAVGLLLAVGIRNAWDITIWAVMRQGGSDRAG